MHLPAGGCGCRLRLACGPRCARRSGAIVAARIMMSAITAYFRSLAARFFHRSLTENDLEEELRSHIQLRADDLERFGLTRVEAERRARIEFGGERKSGFASHLVRQG